jgi:hypothetical protein
MVRVSYKTYKTHRFAADAAGCYYRLCMSGIRYLIKTKEVRFVNCSLTESIAAFTHAVAWNQCTADLQCLTVRWLTAINSLAFSW